MIYDVTQVLKDFDGEDCHVDTDKPESPLLTYKQVISTALNVNSPLVPMTPEEKTQAFFIILKAHENPTKVEYTATELALIIRCVKLVYTPLVAGRTEQYLNQKDIAKEPSDAVN